MQLQAFHELSVLLNVMQVEEHILKYFPIVLLHSLKVVHYSYQYLHGLT